MPTFYPQFSQPTKVFERGAATLNGFLVIRDAIETSKPADSDLEIRFTVRGTAVEGEDFDIIADNADWFGEPADTSHIFRVPKDDIGGGLWIRVLDPTKVTAPRSIIIDFVEVLSGNASLELEDQLLRAVVYIRQQDLWIPPDPTNHIGNLDGLGQGPRIISTNIALFPNWSRGNVDVQWDIPVTAIIADNQTEQRLSTYSYKRTIFDEGDFDHESVQYESDLDMTMSVTYTTTRDKNFDAYFKLLAAQQVGFCWVPFYPQPIYPFVGKGYNPTGSTANRTALFEEKHLSVRKLMMLGKKLMRVNAKNTLDFEVVSVWNSFNEIMEERGSGVLFVDPPMSKNIPDRQQSEIYFFMFPMVMITPLRRPSDTDDVHHMPVTWQLIDL